MYYNYRYYSTALGRWLSRDPIGERGGWNLYGMVSNNPVNLWDYLGQKFTCDEGESDEFKTEMKKIIEKTRKGFEKAVKKARNAREKKKAQEALDKFNKLLNSEQEVKIKDARKVTHPKWQNRNYYDSTTDTIYYNPDHKRTTRYRGIKTNKDGASSFAHEGHHAYEDVIEGKGGNAKKAANDRKNYPNKSEERAVDFENTYRWGAGLDHRYGYW